nr:unnamed protein product [Digitaria exilis]
MWRNSAGALRLDVARGAHPLPASRAMAAEKERKKRRPQLPAWAEINQTEIPQAESKKKSTKSISNKPNPQKIKEQKSKKPGLRSSSTRRRQRVRGGPQGRAAVSSHRPPPPGSAAPPTPAAGGAPGPSHGGAAAPERGEVGSRGCAKQKLHGFHTLHAYLHVPQQQLRLQQLPHAWGEAQRRHGDASSGGSERDDTEE